VRALILALGLLGAGAAAGCASGVSCTDKGGICNAGTVCPNGTELPTQAEFQAAGSGSYTCPSNQNGNDAGNTNTPICCVPIPASN
jgi:hypothetical protein